MKWIYYWCISSKDKHNAKIGCKRVRQGLESRPAQMVPGMHGLLCTRQEGPQSAALSSFVAEDSQSEVKNWREETEIEFGLL